MPEQLTQSQIDALLSKMNAGDELPIESTDSRRIKEYDFASPKKFTKEQLRGLDGVYETFSRMLSSLLSGTLRSACDVEVLQVEELRYYEYNNALPDNSLIGILDFKPENPYYSEANMIVDLATPLGFYLIDRLLGGSGKGNELSRDYTEIELAILENIITKISARLNDAWNSSLAVDISLSAIETNSRLLQVFAPEDIVLVAVLSVKIGNMVGNLSVCMAAEAMEEFIDTFAVRYARTAKKQEPERDEVKKRIILENMLDSQMELKVVFDEFNMSLQDVLELKQNDLIPLGKDLASDIMVEIDGMPWFSAKLGETKDKKSVKLTQQVN